MRREQCSVGVAPLPLCLHSTTKGAKRAPSVVRCVSSTSLTMQRVAWSCVTAGHLCCCMPCGSIVLDSRHASTVVMGSDRIQQCGHASRHVPRHSANDRGVDGYFSILFSFERMGGCLPRGQFSGLSASCLAVVGVVWYLLS